MVWEKECPQTFEIPLALAASCSTLDPQSMVKTNCRPITETYIRWYNEKQGKTVLENLQFRRKGIFRNSQRPEYNSKDRSRKPVLKKKRSGETWLILSMVEQPSWERRWKSGVLKMSVAITSIYSIANMFQELFVLSCLLAKEAE